MSQLTPRIVAYLGSEEGIVNQAYLDGKDVWTWAEGIATTGGNDVLQYKDNPQPLEVCLRASIDLMKTKYLPLVDEAFAGHNLCESQVAGALSFEWRNGTILKAQWVKDFKAGNLSAARKNIEQWTDHGTQVPRMRREQALFFDNRWPDSLLVPIWSVAKPSYKPARPVPTDVMAVLHSIMGGS